MSKKRKANDGVPKASSTPKIKVEPGLETRIKVEPGLMPAVPAPTAVQVPVAAQLAAAASGVPGGPRKVVVLKSSMLKGLNQSLVLNKVSCSRNRFRRVNLYVKEVDLILPRTLTHVSEQFSRVISCIREKPATLRFRTSSQKTRRRRRTPSPSPISHPRHQPSCGTWRAKRRRRPRPRGR